MAARSEDRSEIQGIGDQMSIGIHHRVDRIAEAMLNHGFPRCVANGMGAGLVGEFIVKCRNERVGQLDEIGIGSLDNTAFVEDVGEEGDQHQYDREDRGVPEGKADAHRLKHCVFSEATTSWIRTGRVPWNRARSHCRGGYAKVADRWTRRFCDEAD